MHIFAKMLSNFFFLFKPPAMRTYKRLPPLSFVISFILFVILLISNRIANAAGVLEQDSAVVSVAS